MGTAASKAEVADNVNFTPQQDSAFQPKSERDRAYHSDTSSKVEETESIISEDSEEVQRGKRRTSGGARNGTMMKVMQPDADDIGRPASSSTAATEATSGVRDDHSGGNPSRAAPPSTITSHVADESVQVNLAMADLMAYLQVVANNSSNLPLTRRDDPELGRTVSTLTAEEYARKSAAFIPSEVRVIGGQFTKYGRVWDLPTSEEFTPSDGAQEPGLTNGGACCNALLKVLYDAESEANDVAQSDFMNADNLFDDDDDDTLGSRSFAAKSFESLVLNDITTASTITWADLLRKMKDEMKGVGFSQVPAITSSRKIDLNQPFSLVPPGFDAKKNKKRSLLIGCNYHGTPGAELKASHDDVRSVKDYIVNVHGFPEKKGLMTVLLDDKEHKPPTHLNITEAFKALSEQSKPGDAVFVQFTGHGCRVLDSPIDSEAESYDEALVPSDFVSTGIVRDTLFFKTLLAPMPSGVTVTCLIDCCDTGVMIDLPYSWTTKNDRAEATAKMSLNDDFSFVRFLRVVKTLYESSTFTRLGKTVGSALHDKAMQPKEFGDDDTLLDETVGSLVTMDENEEASKKKGLFNMLAACHSPKGVNPQRNDKNSQTKGGKKSGKNGDTSTIDTKGQPTSSIFQQVMNCTLNAPAEESDEDTFHAAITDDEDDNTFDNTLDTHSYDDGTFGTFDSMTDDANSRARVRTRGGRRR